MNEILDTMGYSQSDLDESPPDAFDHEVMTKNVGKASMMCFWDTESIPDMSRWQDFDVQPPEELIITPFAKMPNVMEAVELTVQSFKDLVNTFHPDEVWVNDMVQVERARDKPRTGILEACEKALEIKLSYEAKWSAYFKTLSTTAEYAEVIALGWAVGPGEIHTLVSGTDNTTERDILEQYWALVAAGYTMCSFNGLIHDHPLMNVRSSLLGIRGTRTLDLRPFSTQVLDLQAVRYRGVSLSKVKGLKTLAKLNGIVVPAGDMDGSRVMDTYKENPEAIHEYVGSDVDILRRLYLKYVNIWW